MMGVSSITEKGDKSPNCVIDEGVGRKLRRTGQIEKCEQGKPKARRQYAFRELNGP